METKRKCLPYNVHDHEVKIVIQHGCRCSAYLFLDHLFNLCLFRKQDLGKLVYTTFHSQSTLSFSTRSTTRIPFHQRFCTAATLHGKNNRFFFLLEKMLFLMQYIFFVPAMQHGCVQNLYPSLQTPHYHFTYPSHPMNYSTYLKQT